MQTNITPFAFEESLVRVITDENGEPWFVAKDVALALDYEWNGIKNIQHVPEEWRRVESVSTLRRGAQDVWVLSEQGLYFFLARSDKPKALPFQKWMAGDVMPSIRKTGQYSTSRPALSASSAATHPAALPPLPPVPEEALHLHPSMRQKLWQDALQTARLDNAGSDVAMHWFAFLCRMVAQRPSTTFDEVRAFFIDRCMPAPGHREKSGVLYEAFRSWRKHIKTPMPSIKAFGQSMNLFARSKKSSGIVYCDIALKN